MAAKLVATLLYCIVGYYLLVNGRLLLKLAFKDQENTSVRANDIV